MLTSLRVRDIVLIEQLDIAFEPGLTVLTGETGAGKSILLDSLSLALGGRGDPGLVREGASQGQVTAAFDLAADHPVRDLLAGNGLASDGDVILRRTQSRDGRSRAFVNDEPVGVNFLKAVGSLLVEIHGQHDERALLDPASHLALLDAFAGLEADAAEVAALHKAWSDAAAERKAAADRLAAAEREADYLRASVAELSELAAEPGEETALADRRQAMRAAEKTASDLAEAVESLGGSGSPIPGLASLLRRLERKADAFGDTGTAALTALAGAIDALREAEGRFETALAASRFDPAALERVEERLFALRAAARKYNVAVEALPALRDRLDAQLAEFDAGGAALAQLARAEAEAAALYDLRATALSEKRGNAARALEAATEAELPALKLEAARFHVALGRVGEGTRTPRGCDTAEFWVTTNPGSRPGPMMRVASGGELSRFLLALKVALADRGSAPTLVFDEIDSGSGGAVADAIGQRLKRLAAGVQVLAVTHAPQVAARATGHLLIAKERIDEGSRTAVRAGLLEDAARREEIARMLAGASVTSEARAAAGRLMAGSD